MHNASASLTAVLGPLACIPLFVNAWGGLLLLIIIIIWALMQERSWIKKYLAQEVALETIGTHHYEVASSNMQRFLVPLRQIKDGNIRHFFKMRRFYDQCAKLAYALHHAELYEDEDATQLVTELRKSVTENRV